MTTLQNADILKGASMELWVKGTQTGAADECIAFATEHDVTFDVQLQEVLTKSHGDYAAQLPQRINWNITSNNMMSKDVAKTYIQYLRGMKAVEVSFRHVQGYSPYESAAQQGIVGNDVEDWTPGDIFAKGKAIIQNMSINTPADGPATLSVTLQGSGDIELYLGDTGTEVETGGATGGATGTTGVQGVTGS